MNQKKPLIQVVIRQAGTAYAFAPLLQRLVQAGQGFELICLSTHNASAVLTGFSLPHKLVRNFSEAEPLLNKDAAILLTGTSEVVFDDVLFWRWARENSIFSIGYVDQWLHWWRRFTYPMEGAPRFNEAPDQILVIDQYSQDEFLRDGCLREKIEIVGNPAFDEKIEAESFVPMPITSSKEYVILFVSEPYSMDREELENFSEESAFYDLCEVVERFMPSQSTAVTIKIRPHPLESKEKILGFIETAKKKFIKINLMIDEDEKMKSIREAHCVVGIESILVFESYLMRRPTACYVPLERDPNPFTLSTKAIDVCRTKSDLERFIDKTFYEAPVVALAPAHARKSLPDFYKLVENKMNLICRRKP